MCTGRREVFYKIVLDKFVKDGVKDDDRLEEIMRQQVETIGKIIVEARQLIERNRKEHGRQPGELGFIVGKLFNSRSTDHLVIVVPEKPGKYFLFTIDQAEEIAMILATVADELRKENAVQ